MLGDLPTVSRGRAGPAFLKSPKSTMEVESVNQDRRGISGRYFLARRIRVSIDQMSLRLSQLWKMKTSGCYLGGMLTCGSKLFVWGMAEGRIIPRRFGKFIQKNVSRYNHQSTGGNLRRSFKYTSEMSTTSHPY